MERIKKQSLLYSKSIQNLVKEALTEEQKDTIFQNDSKMFKMKEKDKLCEPDNVRQYPHCILGFIVGKSQRGWLLDLQP